MSEHNFKLGMSMPEPDIDSSGEFFAALSDHLYARLTAYQIESDVAADITNDVLVHLAQTFAGEKFYVTRTPAMFAKWMAAYNDLRRMHYKDVDRKYGWSDGYSLKVKEKVMKMIQHRQQLRLDLKY